MKVGVTYGRAYVPWRVSSILSAKARGYADGVILKKERKKERKNVRKNRKLDGIEVMRKKKKGGKEKDNVI